MTVQIRQVDRGWGESRNIVGVILDGDDNDLYEAAVCGGVLKGKYM